MTLEFWRCRKWAMKAAKDLLYDEEVIKQIKEAETITEINRIMATARKESTK